MNSIPVIGTAVVNSTHWVSRLLMSIDYPVDNFVIINNNGRGELDRELDNLKKMNHKFIKNIVVSHLPANIGCGGAWNLIIKCYMHSPYWVIVNDDVAFSMGMLEEMANAANEDPTIGIVHGHAGDFNVGSWDLFLIRDFVIQEFGLFDENLYPAYCEDADYIMRLIHKPIKKLMSLNKTYYHGTGERGEYLENGKQTQKTEPELKNKLDIVNAQNIEYLTRKWGNGWRLCEPTVMPFENEGKSVSQTTYDLNFVRQKNLGF
jgi:GT2 family glycosyltransferase